MPLSLKDPNYQARAPLAAICKSTLTFFLHLTILRALALSQSLSLSFWVALAAQVAPGRKGQGQHKSYYKTLHA